MTNPTVGQVRKIVDPTLTDLFNIFKKDILLNMNCHHVATVQSFDSEKQSVSATINYKKTFFDKDVNGVYVPVLKDYPILLDVPVIIISGGGASLTMPIAVGDECLILFNDRAIDNWFQSGQITAPPSSRLHSFSDGFALIGVNSLNNVLENYDPDRASLNNGNARVAVGSEKVLIENESDTLYELISQLIDVIKAITTTNAVVGAPCAISAASQLALDNAKTALGGLLE